MKVDLKSQKRHSRDPKPSERKTQAKVTHLEHTGKREKNRSAGAASQALFQNTPLPMWVYDLETLHFLEVNKAAIEKYGYTRADFLRMRITDIRPPEDVARLLENIKQVRPDQQHSSPWRHRLKNGSIIDVEIISRRLDFAGRPAALAVAQDLSERRRVEEQVHFQASLVANVSDAIIATDSQFNIQSWNPAAEVMYGWAEEEVRGKPTSEFIRTEFFHTSRAEVTRQVLEQGVWRGEVLQYHRDGAKMPVMSSVTVIKDHEGAPLGFVTVNRDITERKRIEEQLRQSEESFSKAFRSSPTALIITRLADGKYIEANSAYSNIVGFARTELIGHLTTEFDIYVYPEQRQEIVSQLRANGSLYNYEATIQNKAGEHRTVLASLEPIRFNEEHCLITTLLDITERKRAEEALRKSEQRFRALTENSWDSVALFGADGTILYGSPSTNQILGYELDEFVGRNAFELIHPDDQAFVTERLMLSLQKPREHVSVYARVLHKHGSWRWLEGTFTNLLEEPSVQAIVNNYHDFTERKQIEDRNRFLANLVANVSDAVIAVDMQQNILSWNKAAEMIYGWKEQEVIGRLAQDILDTEFLETARETVTKQIVEQGYWSGEVLQLHRDGRRFPALSSVALYQDSKGRPAGIVAVNHDITERKQAEETTALLATIVESSDDAIFGKTLNGIILSWNAGAQKIYGYTANEVKGRHVSMLAPPDRKEEITHILEQLQHGETIHHLETVRMRKDGTLINVALTLSPIRDSLGNVTGASTVARDITERKRAEEREYFLATASETLASSLDYATTLKTVAQLLVPKIADWCTVYLTTTDSSIEQVALTHANREKVQWALELQKRFPPNPSAPTGVAEVIRSGQAEFTPEIPAELLEPIKKDPEMSKLLDELQLTGGMTVPLTLRGQTFGAISLVSAESRLRYTIEDLEFAKELAHRMAIAVENARLYRSAQQLNEELEQRVLERTAELSQANALLNAMLENIPDQIYFKDIHSRFIRNSVSQAKLMGLNDPLEAVGKSDFDFFPHAQRAFDEEQEMMRLGQSIVDLEEYVVWPDKQATWVSTTKVPFRDLAGRIIGIFGISRDITERKQAQEAVRKAKDELEVANKELESFSYSVSHDLRAPLRSIDGFSQALLEDYGTQLPEQGQNYLRRVRTNAQRMAELIDDLLGLARVTRAPVERTQVDLSALAENILEELQREQPERQVKQLVTPGLTVEADARLLRIAMTNLLNNAWKFTMKQAEAQIEFGVQEDNGKRIYFVRDNGSGFDMTYVGKLFGAFQRLHSANEFPGTGIGLATVQRVFHKHGGVVWAEGVVNQGATFYFTL